VSYKGVPQQGQPLSRRGKICAIIIRRVAIKPLIGLGCSPVLVSGTK
jgi:hypothetical protein